MEKENEKKDISVKEFLFIMLFALFVYCLGIYSGYMSRKKEISDFTFNRFFQDENGYIKNLFTDSAMFYKGKQKFNIELNEFLK